MSSGEVVDALAGCPAALCTAVGGARAFWMPRPGGPAAMCTGVDDAGAFWMPRPGGPAAMCTGHSAAELTNPHTWIYVMLLMRRLGTARSP